VGFSNQILGHFGWKRENGDTKAMINSGPIVSGCLSGTDSSLKSRPVLPKKKKRKKERKKKRKSGRGRCQ
jgi:hypothetical protein